MSHHQPPTRNHKSLRSSALVALRLVLGSAFLFQVLTVCTIFVPCLYHVFFFFFKRGAFSSEGNPCDASHVAACGPMPCAMRVLWCLVAAGGAAGPSSRSTGRGVQCDSWDVAKGIWAWVLEGHPPLKEKNNAHKQKGKNQVGFNQPKRGKDTRISSTVTLLPLRRPGRQIQ